MSDRAQPAPKPRASGARRPALRTLALAAPVILLLLPFFVYPTVSFLLRAFDTPEGQPWYANFERFFTASAYGRVLAETLIISAWVTLATVLVAYPVAYVLARAPRRSKSWWALFILLPFWSSFLVRTFALVLILGRNGPLNDAAMAIGLVDSPMSLLFSRGAVLVGMTSVMTPFAVLTMIGVFERIDRVLTPAAETLGARPSQAFFRIYLPLSMPGVTAAALLVFVTSIGFFITPALLGSRYETMIAQPIIQQVLDLGNWSFAASMCVILFVITIAVFVLYDRLVGISSLVQQGGGQRRRGGIGARLATRVFDTLGDGFAALGRLLPLRGGKGRGGARAVAGFSVFVLLVLNVPVLFLLPVSVTESAFVSWPPSGFTLQWYAQFFDMPIWLQGTTRSFLVAFGTSLLCFLIGVPAAFAMLRLSGRKAAALMVLIVSPMVLPKIVIAVGLFYLYARIGLVGTEIGLVLGHTVVALPYFFISLVAVLKSYNWRLDDAAASLGASPWKVRRHITLPLISTGLISSAIFAFVVSLDELNIALFTSGGLASTLPKLMWESATVGFTPLLAAVSTMFLLFLTVVVLSGLYLGRRR
ncbi:ABC transporter permease subunit [Pararhodobacter aggregans]|uniref:ABC transporter permease n=1 Tax=Pararhodobacter aggregans TaxID=404875 RepID=A0A2T7UR75_9RHOB|nr:ABC transporter permease subunit [Pararhodobacter aggregans]PTX01977.1 putative spermidine/putrescine transport system permease protein [Pararhodobacter aggregans]PVE47162.1 ABC transporter permease [Pararhodobacter aggregans]